MKTMAGILVVVALVLTGCEPLPTEAQPQGIEAAPSEVTGQQESSLASGDCTVSLKCANGSTASCSGTLKQCSIDNTGLDRVWCNNTAYDCLFTIPTCGCAQDNCCSEVCARDPDCGTCVPGRTCTSNSQCGGTLSGRCNTVTNKCTCIIGVDGERAD